MTTHLLKPGMLLSELRARCGLPLHGKATIPRGAMLGTEDGICHVDCAGCLRDLIVDLRLKAAGAFVEPHLGEPKPEDVWLCGGDTGTSSLTIWRVMTGRPTPGGSRVGIPHDPSDFARCHGLLELLPAWRARMGEVAAQHPEWTALVEAWPELTALYLEELPTGSAPKLYERMQALTTRPE